MTAPYACDIAEVNAFVGFAQDSQVREILWCAALVLAANLARADELSHRAAAEAREADLRADVAPINDLVRVGSEVLRIRKLPEGPDAGVAFFGFNFVGEQTVRNDNIRMYPVVIANGVKESTI